MTKLPDWSASGVFELDPVSGELRKAGVKLAIYFEQVFRGARNLWKMSVDPNTLKATAIERLTTGPEVDSRAKYEGPVTRSIGPPMASGCG